jgi:hypothetical protein
MCLAGWDALQSYGGMIRVKDKLTLKIDQVLARCGWAVDAPVASETANRILIRYPHCNEAQLLYIAGQTAKRLASDIQRASKRAAKWQAKDAENLKRKDEWKAQRADAMRRVHELMGKLSMPVHERFALMTLDQGGDAELLRVYPASTRNASETSGEAVPVNSYLLMTQDLKPWIRGYVVSQTLVLHANQLYVDRTNAINNTTKEGTVVNNKQKRYRIRYRQTFEAVCYVAAPSREVAVKCVEKGINFDFFRKDTDEEGTTDKLWRRARAEGPLVTQVPSTGGDVLFSDEHGNILGRRQRLQNFKHA